MTKEAINSETWTVAQALEWALHRIRISLDCGVNYDKAMAALQEAWLAVERGPAPSASAVSETPCIDLEQEFWKQIRAAASEAKWMPPEYMMNDWVADVCSYLRRDDAQPHAPVSAIEQRQHFIAPRPLPIEVARALNKYDLITAPASRDNDEWDFVMTATDWRVIRDFFKLLKPGGAPTVITNPPRPA